MSITASLATQSAIMRENAAQAAYIRGNQAQQNLALSGGDFNSVARKEAAIEAAKERASIQAKAARAEREALKNKKKLNVVG